MYLSKLLANVPLKDVTMEKVKVEKFEEYDLSYFCSANLYIY